MCEKRKITDKCVVCQGKTGSPRKKTGLWYINQHYAVFAQNKQWRQTCMIAKKQINAA